jgi:hypothetical protein
VKAKELADAVVTVVGHVYQLDDSDKIEAVVRVGGADSTITSVTFDSETNELVVVAD